MENKDKKRVKNALENLFKDKIEQQLIENGKKWYKKGWEDAIRKQNGKK